MDKKKKDDKSVKSSKSKSKDAKSKSKDKPKEDGQSKKAAKEPKEKSKKSAAKEDLNRSEVSSIPPSPPINLLCVHHKFPFIYFCETCEQLICNQCIVFGPHNNHLHRILKITDAYRSRVFFLSEAIRSNLVDKRDKIIAQLHRLQYRVEEIRFVKNIIERDIRSEYGGYLQRLKSSEGTKLTVLSHEMSVLQRDVDSINELGNKFFELTNLEADSDKQICRFLSKSKHMYEAIEYYLNKPEKVRCRLLQELPHVETRDLPQDVQKNRMEIKKALSAKEISEFKNQLIWQLLQDGRTEAERIKRQLELKADTMIRNLSDEAESLNEQLSQFQLVCSFCLVALDPSIVNEKCVKNTVASEAGNLDRKLTAKLPAEQYLGNGRHFFSTPTEQYYSLHGSK